MKIDLFKPLIHEDAIAAGAEAMRSGWLGMGGRVEQFEKDFSGYIGAPHAVAVNTCTSALHLAVKLLDLKPGAEVIVTPNSFVATSQVILWEKLTPVFADIEMATGNIDPASVGGLMSEKTGAIMGVHFAGYPCDLAGLAKFGVPVIEDCAHAVGTWYDGRHVGSGGNLAAFSFGATKNLTTGDGGMLICQNAEQVDRARKLRYLGVSKDTFQRMRNERSAHWEYDVPALGLRYHMNDPTAAIGSVQLKHLERENTRRREIAALYDQLLRGISGLTFPAYDRRHTHAMYLYFVLAENRDALAKSLMAQDIMISVHYKPCSDFGIFRGPRLACAERFYACELTLPMHPRLTDEEVVRVAEAIKKGW